MNQDINEYFQVFTNIDNPVFISLFIVIIFIVTVFAFIKFVIFPLKNAHRTEKENLEQKNLKILALFAEVSPDPLIRMDYNGIILDANNAAKSLFDDGKLIGKHIKEIIPIRVDNCINKGNLTFLNKDYSYYLKKLEADNLILLYLRDITDNIQYERRLKELSKYTQNKVEQERQRIAVELHDGIGQNLSLAKIKLFKFMKEHFESNSLQDLESMNMIIENAINELKQISYNLKPRVLDEMGFAPALLSLCSDISKESGLNIKPEIKGKITRLPKSTEASLYRITQEAICNIIKHANATECKVQLKYDTEKVKLDISDNGIGFDLENLGSNKKSLGLLNMKQRVEELDGSFKIETAPEQGTLLFIEINLGRNYG